MLKTNSFLSTKERNSGPKMVRKQPLSVFELRLLLALMVAGLASALAASGQAPAEKEITTQEVPSQFTLQVQRNMVLVKAVVRDSEGRQLSGLSRTVEMPYQGGETFVNSSCARKRDDPATGDGTPALQAMPDTPCRLDFAARPPDT